MPRHQSPEEDSQFGAERLDRHRRVPGDPVGKRIKPSWQREWRTVVGVVGDVITYKALPKDSKTLTQWYESIRGDVYFPASQGLEDLPFERAVIVRAADNINAGGLAQQLIASVKTLDPNDSHQ